jgi:hypothetical protein
MDLIEKCLEVIEKDIISELHIVHSSCRINFHKELVEKKVLSGIIRQYLLIYENLSNLSLSLLTIRFYDECLKQNIITAEQFSELSADTSDLLAVLNYYGSVVFRVSQSERRQNSEHGILLASTPIITNNE